MKNIRNTLTGSLKKIIPSNAVPVAPIPVQTAYAVPIGIVWVALSNSAMLSISDIPKHIYQ